MPEVRIGRKRKVFINIWISVVSEIVSMICSLILPRLILSHFGSTYNGIINSITQFISFVTLLRAGVGGVTRAALYKPLSQNDSKSISAIVNATEKYMRKIAAIFLILMTCMAAIYPFIVHDFDWLFSFSLFIIIGITTFIQYYFGITYQMLLMADQRQYVYSIINIVSIVLNTLFGSILIIWGCGIHAVKLVSAVTFAITPIALNWYVRRYYRIDKSELPDDTALSQRWDALGHQIAYYVLTSTDLTVLTFMSNVKYVSVYSVYFLVIKAIKMVIKTFSQSIEAGFGNVIAKEDGNTLKKTSSIYECFICLFCALVFGCSLILIIPFVQVYTKDVTDIDYIRPIFAILLISGELMYCLRLPYMSLVEASGLYKQTKKGAYVEAAINILSSIVLCLFVDPLIAVATGTLLAMTVRTIEISRFADKMILNRSRLSFYRMIFVCFLIMGISYVMCMFIPFSEVCESYVDWVIRGAVTFVIVIVVELIVACIFYKQTTIETIKTIASIFYRKRG